MTVVRRLVFQIGPVRGVPRALYWLRRWTFPQRIVSGHTPDGIPITIDREDYGQVALIYYDYCPEIKAFLSDAIRNGDFCVDLGANIGLLTVVMARLVGATGAVVAVEPNAASLASLQQTVSRCHLRQIEPVLAGIGARRGRGDLFCPPGASSESFEVRQPDGHGQIDVLSYGDLVACYGADRQPDFIKVDVEGAEVDFVTSLERSDVTRNKPMILMEIHPGKCEPRGMSAQAVYQKLLGLGYAARLLKAHNRDYQLVLPPAGKFGHHNVLFATPAHLARRATLRHKWDGAR